MRLSIKMLCLCLWSGITLAGADYPIPNTHESENIKLRAASKNSLGGHAVNTKGEKTNTVTSFEGGIAVNRGESQRIVAMSLSEPVEVTGQIAVDSEHVGKKADIVLYAALVSQDSEQQIYYMLNDQGDILPWDESPESLVAFKRQVTLSAKHLVNMYQGHFVLPGKLLVFFGYRLNDLVITNEQPIEITIAPGQARPTSATHTLLAFNDLGMHCMEKEFSVFTVLPPFNVVNAQVIERDSKGIPHLLDDQDIEVHFSPVMDAQGSINSSSIEKTQFWSYASDLFGKTIAPGEGLTGLYMPQDTQAAQPMTYRENHQWFSAAGIPISTLDDNLQKNYYPLLRITAVDKKTGKELTATDVVVPVSDEISCPNCHAIGQIATQGQALHWANDEDINVQAKKNILLLHDENQGTNLSEQTPVLCASCHYSPALDLTGAGPQNKQIGKKFLSKAMHGRHAFLDDHVLVDDQEGSMEKTCYQCHPGKETKCLRTVMQNSGVECRECHGGMRSVAGETPLLEGGSIDGKNDGGTRRPWQDLPRCQSCHTGDILDHLSGPDFVQAQDGLHLFQAFKKDDASASPIVATNKRFAENPDTLYRNSQGHGGVACEGCHGSTHSEWANPDAQANDNVAAQQIQGHSGKIIECNACHEPGSLPLTLGGPHGLHNVNDARWVNGHKQLYRRDNNSCKACHGKQLEGSVLSKVAVDRTFQVEGREVTLKKDTQVSCSVCHRKP